jgi:hypothetical protein
VGHDEFVAMLRSKWPDVSVQLGDATAPAAGAVEWTVSLPEGVLDGSQHRNGRGVYLDGVMPVIAQFAAWWRAQVPPEQPLWLIDLGHTMVVPLEDGFTESDVAIRFQAAAEASPRWQPELPRTHHVIVVRPDKAGHESQQEGSFTDSQSVRCHRL